MAKAGRVYHWKHGWIPVSPEARAFLAGMGPNPTASKSPDVKRKNPVADIKFMQDEPGGYQGALLTDRQKAIIANAVDEFMTEFPKLNKKVVVKALHDKEMDISGSLATTDMRHETGHEIDVNIDKLMDDSAAQAMVEHKDQWQATIPSQAKTKEEFQALAIKHEMAHFLNAEMRESLGYTGMGSQYGPAGPLDELSNEGVTPRQMGFTRDQVEGAGMDQPLPRYIADPLGFRSMYAISGNPDEWIAEAVLDGMINRDKAPESSQRAFKIAKEKFGG